MDPKVQEVIDGAMKICNPDIKSLEPQIDSKMFSAVDSCFSKSSANPERFAECITDKNQRIDDIMKAFQFKVLFFSQIASKCLAHNKPVSECTQETVKGLKEVISNTRKTIDQL
jgi:hypothetical protein